jgi:hypothetical protein
MKFNLINNYYIRVLDSLNWILCQTMTPEDKEKEPYEKILSYHHDISVIWKLAVERIGKETVKTASTYQEILDVVQRLEKLKDGIKYDLSEKNG